MNQHSQCRAPPAPVATQDWYPAVYHIHADSATNTATILEALSHLTSAHSSGDLSSVDVSCEKITEERLRMSLLDGDGTADEENRAVLGLFDEEELELIQTLQRRQERETELQMEEFTELQRVYGRTLRRAFRHLKRFPETKPRSTQYSGHGEEEEEALCTNNE